MKYILSILALLCLCGKTQAQGVGYVNEVAISTGGVWTVAIPSAPVVAGGNVDVTTLVTGGKLNGAYAVEVYNLAGSTKTINCSYDPNLVATPVNSPYYGREIPAGIGMVWHVLQGKVKVYCQTQNTGGITYATITQIR